MSKTECFTLYDVIAFFCTQLATYVFTGHLIVLFRPSINGYGKFLAWMLGDPRTSYSLF